MGHASLGLGAFLVQGTRGQTSAHQCPGRGNRDQTLLPRAYTPPSLHRPASGFYEWRREGTGKQPYFVRPAEDEVFALAAIWDHWEGKQGEVIESVAIITTSANELMQPIHDRMPVIFEEEDVAEWIAPTTKLEKALPMLKPCSLTRMMTYSVSSLVNSARHDGPACVAKVDESVPDQF